MQVAQALSLVGNEAVAFVGAGGKTSAMFSLAKDLEAPIILTTSTHLGAWQASLADRHQILTSSEGIQQLAIENTKTILLTGPEDTGNRLTGLPPAHLEAVFNYCREKKFPLLIEADGARQRPLKAPADYEPVVPAWVDQVVVMAGLSALEKPLSHETVHRPELFSKLAGLQIGGEIKPMHLAAALGSALGGVKGIPEGAGRSLFLNQAEGDRASAYGAGIAEVLSGVYDRVLVGSLHQPASDGPIFSAHSKTAGIILAAGGSERFGRTKQILDWMGKPFVVQVARCALIAGLDPVIVVTGADRESVEEVISDLPIKSVFNPDWSLGQSTSLKAGLAALSLSCDRAMFLLSDQPQISVHLIRALIERHNQKREPITAPMMRERRGNPVMFAGETFPVLQEASGDMGGRSVFSRFKVDHITWVDDRALFDVDQEKAYHTLIQAYFDIN